MSNDDEVDVGYVTISSEAPNHMGKNLISPSERTCRRILEKYSSCALSY